METSQDTGGTHEVITKESNSGRELDQNISQGGRNEHSET